MSRVFDGVDDVITFAAGDAATLQNGALSLVYLIKIGSNHRGGLYDGRAGGVRRLGINPFDNGNIFFNITGQGFPSAAYTSIIDEWAVLAFTKTSGASQARMHTYVYDTATWTHADMGAMGGNGSGTVDQFFIGSFDSGQFLDANLDLIGLWTGTALSDADLETMVDALADWAALDPSVLLDFHGNPATPITDLMGSGADQTAIVGTSDAPGDDAPGFDFTFTPPAPPPSEGTASFRMYLALAATGAAPPFTARPSRLTARGVASAIRARGGYGA